MPGPSVRSPAEEFRRRRRAAQEAALSEACARSALGATDPNHSAREKWREETADALRQLPPVPRLDQM